MTEEEKEIDYKRECEVLQLQLHLLREEKDNLIQKQQEELEKLRNRNKDLLRKLRNRVKEVNKLIKYSSYKKEFSRLNTMLEQKNRQIDLMAKYIDINDFDINCSSLCVHEDCQEECIKQYFVEQAKEVEE